MCFSWERSRDATKMPREATQISQGHAKRLPRHAKIRSVAAVGRSWPFLAPLGLSWARLLGVTWRFIKQNLERQEASKTPQDAPRRSQDASKTPQDGAKAPQDTLRTVQDVSKTSQDASKAPQSTENRAKIKQNWHENQCHDGCYVKMAWKEKMTIFIIYFKVFLRSWNHFRS